jgi:hypothetical protein
MNDEPEHTSEAHRITEPETGQDCPAERVVTPSNIVDAGSTIELPDVETGEDRATTDTTFMIETATVTSSVLGTTVPPITDSGALAPRIDYRRLIDMALEGTPYEFIPDTDGKKHHRIHVPLREGRKQTVYLVADTLDSESAPLICLYTICGPANGVHHEELLKRNMRLSYGAYAIAEHRGERYFVMVNNLMAEATSPLELRKSISYLAKHGDSLERALSDEDVR